MSPSAARSGARDGSAAPHGGKGKERADTAQPEAQEAAPEPEEQDAEDEVFEFSDDEVSLRLL